MTEGIKFSTTGIERIRIKANGEVIGRDSDGEILWVIIEGIELVRKKPMRPQDVVFERENYTIPNEGSYADNVSPETKLEVEKLRLTLPRNRVRVGDDGSIGIGEVGTTVPVKRMLCVIHNIEWYDGQYSSCPLCDFESNHE